MKSSAQPSIYFSAYPLKAVTQSSASTSENQSPYLRAVLAGKEKMSNRVRVFAMANPYSAVKAPAKRIMPPDTKLSQDIELTEKDWFNNYE